MSRFSNALPTKTPFAKRLLLGAPLALLALSGCTRDYKFQPVDMWNNSRLKPYEQVNFFSDRNSSRVPPEGTIARSQDRSNEPLYFGTENGNLIDYNPIFKNASPADKEAILQRGQERYNIYCQPCHGLAGYGDGMIVKRGFAKPPSYHIQRLRTIQDGHIYDVIKNGYGAMYSYGARVPTRDRWAIVAYIRALQLSQSQSKAAAEGKPSVSPPLEGEEFLGPSAGREAHGTGPGGAGEPGDNGLGEGKPSNDTSVKAP